MAKLGLESERIVSEVKELAETLDENTHMRRHYEDGRLKAICFGEEAVVESATASATPLLGVAKLMGAISAAEVYQNIEGNRPLDIRRLMGSALELSATTQIDRRSRIGQVIEGFKQAL